MVKGADTENPSDLVNLIFTTIASRARGPSSMERKQVQSASELPLLIDYPWWTSAGFFAVAIVGGLLACSLSIRARVALGAVALIVTASLWSGAYFATWSARFDAEGVSVHAPFDVLRRQGSVPWRDVDSVAIGGRRSFYQLRLASRDGTAAELALVDLPTDVVGMLTSAVVQRTRHAEHRQRTRDYLILARRAARPVRGITMMRVQPAPVLRVAQVGSPANR